MDTFASLISPLEDAEFFDTYWQKQPLYLSRGEDYFENLISLHDIDTLITQHSLDKRFHLTYVDGSEANSIGEVKIEQARGTDGAIDYESVCQAFARGNSLRVGCTEQFSESVRQVTAALESRLSASATASTYITPRHQQMLRRHADPHDVFLLQTDGKKHWKVYAPSQDRPLSYGIVLGSRKFSGPYAKQRLGRHSPGMYSTTLTSQNGTDDLLFDVTLTPGDFLYIPRGFDHEATTSDDLSMHITVGVYGYSWHVAAVYALSRLVEEHGELRDFLPHDLPTRNLDAAGIEETCARIAELVRTHLRAEHIKDALGEIANRLAEGRGPTPVPGHLADVDRTQALDLDDDVKIPEHLTWDVGIKGEHVRLDWGNGRELRLPAHTKPLLDFMARKERFRVGDLPATFDDQSKKVLVRYLVKQKLLTFA